MIQRTAEVVSPKHPDKLCDRVSDAILDLFLEKASDNEIKQYYMLPKTINKINNFNLN